MVPITRIQNLDFLGGNRILQSITLKSGTRPRRLWVSWLGRVLNPQNDKLLEDTSRSFFLTLKVLPKKTRAPIGMLYLLARLADTIADSDVGEADELVKAIESYNDFTQGRNTTPPDLSKLASIQKIPAEATLLEEVESVITNLGDFSESDKNRILTCLDIIVSGQVLDLQRFRMAGLETVTPLNNDEELDDYTYRVAGCVGEFWTHLTLDHLLTFGEAEHSLFFERGVRFGKALQLINILRDVAEDLELGRCYIPEPALSEIGLRPEDLTNVNKMSDFRPLFDKYIDLAVSHLDAAVEYIEMLPHRQFRLRIACILPVLIGQRTLQLLRVGNVLDKSQRIKVSRAEIKSMRNKTLRAILFRGASKKLLNTNRYI